MMTEALTGIDRSTLLAERAEAEAQLRAAEATLGITPAAANGGPAGKEEPDEAAQKSPGVAGAFEAVAADGSEADGPAADGPELDVAALRRAAASARAADDVLARAAFEAAERPLPAEARLGSAETAFAQAAEIQDDLPAAWRRLVGALISATGMAIVIGALGWNTYWLLVPIALIAIMTVDLRVAGRAAREASAEAARELASVGVAGPDGLQRVRQERARVEEAESRLAAARVDRDAAYARFQELAPGRAPSEVEDIVAEYEAEVAARAAARARAEAEAARARAEAEVAPAAEAEAAPAAEPEAVGTTDAGATGRSAGAEEDRAEDEPTGAEAAPPVAASAEWWFGAERPPSRPAAATPAPEAAPAPAASETEAEAAAATGPPPPVRALAERLSAEGRAALARIEAQLAALDRLELAKKSLEWHESQAGGEQPQPPPPAEAEVSET
jgi:hypothetical protein